jgi:hypothetical protein
MRFWFVEYQDSSFLLFFWLKIRETETDRKTKNKFEVKNIPFLKRQEMTTKKRVLIFDVKVFTPHIETSIEIAESHIERGDIVQIVNVANNLPFKEYLPLLCNPAHYKATILRVKKKVDLLERFANKRDINYSQELLIEDHCDCSLPEDILHINDLKEFWWNDMDMGMGIASLLISRTADIEPLIIKYREVINEIFQSSVLALHSFEQWYKKFQPDLVYIRNARSPLNRPILRLCQRKAYNLRVIDRGGAPGKYTITPNYNHDREMINNLIIEHWDRAHQSESEKISLGSNYFVDRQNGVTTSRFIAKQIKHTLPSNWNVEKKNIVFFTGSFTEFAAIDKANSADIIFSNQFEAVIKIADYLKNHNEYKFYVRIHPNTKQRYRREYEKWRELMNEMKGLILFIDGDDPADSYELAKASDKVIAYMSSVGIEAAFLGVPSIVIGNSLYRRLGSNYTPASKQELFDLLTTNDLPPKSKTGALKYGFFYSTVGYDYKNFVYTGKHLGHYRGVDLNSLKSYPLNTRVVAFTLFFLDQIRAKGLISAIKTIFNRKKMTDFIKNPISEM